MKILKRTAAYLLAAAILAAGGTTAGAAAESNTDTGFSDVDAGSWYADAVAYVRFASVYREFKDVNTFMDELKKFLK